MKKKLLALALILCLVILSGCQSGNGNRYEVVTNNPGAAQNQPTQNVNPIVTDAPTEVPEIDFDSGDYDPASEEGLGLEDPSLGLEDASGVQSAGSIVTVAPTMNSAYAGATPVMLDPIDKPTPTAVPPLTFTYQTYDATKLSLSFQGPAGWIVDNSYENTYIIYNPDPAMAYAATLTITANSVEDKYDSGDLKDVVRSMLDTVGASGFEDFNRSNTASRTLIDASGIYANYDGVLLDGTRVAGRVHATWINKVLYTVHITYPYEYTNDYKEGVYDKLRDTITVTK